MKRFIQGNKFVLQVSRCGMIYMEPSSLGWRPVVKSWMNEMPAAVTEMHRSTINDMFERFCDPCIQLVRKGGVKVRFNLGVIGLTIKQQFMASEKSLM